MRKVIASALVASTFIATAASADIRLTAKRGTNPYQGGITYDFDSAATTPTTSCTGCIQSETVSGLYARPFGGSGNFFSVGPSTTGSATISLGTVGAYWLSFIWGSADAYNSIDFLDAAGNVLKSFAGDALPSFDGDQGDPVTNPVVTFHFSGTDAARVAAFRLNSPSQNAFEIDNIRVVGVPETATWGMMILGFGLIGGSLRRRGKRGSTSVRFA